MLKMLVVFRALSTAFRPLTLVAPPFWVLIRLQPGPSGTQLTDGTGKDWLAAAICRFWAAERLILRRSGGAMACARACAPAPLLAAAADTAGVLSGPVSSEQVGGPTQPVAAVPANVGLNVPRLEELTEVEAAAVRAPAALRCGAAVADPAVATTSIAGMDRSDTSAIL